MVHILGDVMNPAEPDARPVPTLFAQPPAFELSGSTSTGKRVPVPFTSALPCFSDCPTIFDALPTPKRTSTQNGGVGAFGPRCTGLGGAMGVGVVGLGVMGAAGIL